MKRPIALLIAAVIWLAIAPTVMAGTTTVEMWCYIDAGGTYCYPAGSPEAEAAAQAQAAYFESMGYPPDTSPRRIEYEEVAIETTTTTTVPTVCFVLVGGNYCYPEGSPEAAFAAEQEAIYREAIEGTLISPSAPVSVAPISTTTEVATTAPPTTVQPDDVIFEPMVPTTVEVAVGLPPVPPQQLPVTGGFEATLIFFAAGFVTTGVALLAWRHWSDRRLR